MLRNFYLLIFLVCIKWCICNDYRQNQNIGDKLNDRKLGRISDSPLSHRSKNDKNRRSSSQEYEVLENVEPAAQFDLVNFLQKPRRGRNHDEPGYFQNMEHKREERQSDSSGSYKPILKPNYELNDDAELSDLENIGRSFDKINQELNLSGPDIRQLYPTALIHKELNIGDVRDLEHKPFKRNADTEPYKVHKQQKKWIPFFSHKKEASKNVVVTKNDNVTAEAKKKIKTRNANFVTSSYSRNKRKIKRSFTDVLCPVCKHRFAVNELETTRESQDYPIHNSRQYYQLRNTRAAPKTEYGDKVMPPILDSLQRLSIKYVDESPVDAQQDMNKFQREQQLKQLEELEKSLATTEKKESCNGGNKKVNGN